MTGREVLIQGLREKCLFKLMTEKYHAEGSTFFTFLNYIDSCFAEPEQSLFKYAEERKRAKSLDDCYDWSTVMIGKTEEVDTLNQCVWGSFEIYGEIDTDN